MIIIKTCRKKIRQGNLIFALMMEAVSTNESSAHFNEATQRCMSESFILPQEWFR
jgi:hypothetical protein